MAKDHGGCAFPLHGQDGVIDFGMSLRDYFASNVLTGVFANPHGWPHDEDAPEMARRAYVLADAMIEARKR